MFNTQTTDVTFDMEGFAKILAESKQISSQDIKLLMKATQTHRFELLNDQFTDILILILLSLVILLTILGYTLKRGLSNINTRTDVLEHRYAEDDRLLRGRFTTTQFTNR